MISDTGQNLSVLVITEPEMDWQTFGTWYSVFKNLPDAKISLVILRNGKVPFVYYQWAKRLKVPTLKIEPFAPDGTQDLNWLGAIKAATEARLAGPEVLVIKPLVVALDTLNPILTSLLNNREFLINEHAWFLRNQNTNTLINDLFLEDKPLEISSEKIYLEAKEAEDSWPLVTYKKGCGRWIDTAKGCPFSCAAGLVSMEMTANEARVIELWKKCVPLYNAVI